VTVQSGETVSDLTIRLVTVPAFEMSGVVVDEAGAPAADVMVILMDSRRGADSFLSRSMILPAAIAAPLDVESPRGGGVR
jgi:hypothetical protein